MLLAVVKDGSAVRVAVLVHVVAHHGPSVVPERLPDVPVVDGDPELVVVVVVHPVLSVVLNRLQHVAVTRRVDLPVVKEVSGVVDDGQLVITVDITVLNQCLYLKSASRRPIGNAFFYSHSLLIIQVCRLSDFSVDPLWVCLLGFVCLFGLVVSLSVLLVLYYT